MPKRVDLSLTGAPQLFRESFCWFDLHKYDQVSAMSLGEWVRALEVREACFVRVEDKYLNFADSEVKDLLNDPLEFGSYPSIWRFNDSDEADVSVAEAIKDVTFIDMFGFPESSSPSRRDILDDLEAFDAWLADATRPPFQEGNASSRTFRSLISASDFPESLPVWVDLSADDSFLVNRFQEWLKGARAEFGATQGPRFWSDRVRANWAGARVLPYIDLLIYCARIEHGRATQNLMASLLFPDEFDVDVTERLRKVVNPLARKLLSHRFLSALRWRLARSAPE